MHPPRHVGVHAGLELEQDEETGARLPLASGGPPEGPAGLELDTPDHVADAVVEVGADVLSAFIRLSVGKSSSSHHSGARKPAQGVFDHADLGEDEFVGGVG